MKRIVIEKSYIWHTVVIFIVCCLSSCRNNVSDDAITKEQLREQTRQSAVYNEESLTAQLQNLTPEQKARVLELLIESLDDGSFELLLEHPRVQNVLKKKIKSDQLALAKELSDLAETEKEVTKSVKVDVSRLIGAKPNVSSGTMDPFLSYFIKANHLGQFDCQSTDTLETYWFEVLKLTKSPHLALGRDFSFYEQLIKSCLLFYSSKDKMVTCKSVHVDSMNSLCKSVGSSAPQSLTTYDVIPPSQQ